MNYHHPINNRLCEVWIISKSTWTLITFDLRLQPPIRVQSVRQGTLATQGCKNKLDTSRIGQIYQRQCQNHYRWRTNSLQICWVISGNVLCSNTCMAGYCAHLSHTLGGWKQMLLPQECTTKADWPFLQELWHPRLWFNISVQFINVPEDQRDCLTWTFLRQGHS